MRNFYILQLITFFTCILLMQLFAQPEDVSFRNLTPAEGLPTTSVTDITQDAFGFVWIGSWDYVYKYDGNSFIKIPSAIEGRFLEPDKKGGVWISFKNTVGYYNPFNDLVLFYKISNPIRFPDIEIDKSGTVWVTSADGIVRFDKKSNKFITDSGQHKGYVQGLHCRKDGSLLFEAYGTNIKDNNTLIGRRGTNGRYSYEPFPPDLNRSSEKQRFNYSSNYHLLPLDSTGILLVNEFGWASKKDEDSKWAFQKPLNNRTPLRYYSAKIGPEGYLWIFTNEELLKINIRSGEIAEFKPNLLNSNSVLPLSVYLSPGGGMFFDRQGILWIPCFSQGISRLNLYESDFWLLKDASGSKLTDVISAMEDKDGSFWVGSRSSKGLLQYNKDKKIIKIYYSDSENSPLPSGKNSPSGRSVSILLSHPFILSLAQSDDGSVWAGGGSPGFQMGGLSRIRPGTNQITRFKNDPEDPNSITADWIFQILVDGSDRVWISPEDDNRNPGGICFINPKTNKVTRGIKDPVSGTTDNYPYILELVTSKGDIIIGTRDLDTTYLVDHKTLAKIPFGPKIPAGQNWLYMQQDYKNKIWFKSDDSFGYLDSTFNKVEFSFKLKENNFPAKIITGLQSDKEGKLWLSTDNGIIKFDPVTKNLIQFGYERGLQGISFSKYVNYRGPSGKIYFGGYGGINIFDPEAIKSNPYPPEMVFTGLKLDGKSIRPGENSAITKPIFAAGKIIVNPDVMTISIDFSAIHFAGYKRNNYKYRLEGFDKSWVNGGNIGNATYTNLSPGEYTLFIKGSNWDEVWSNGNKSITIIVLPPWWKTWWAYTLYILIGLGLLYSLRNYELNRTNLKNQVKLDEVKLREREETDRMKSHFFANISHEFRTPLTLILGPSESIAADSNQDEIKKKAGTIKRNANRLLNLINQLLDLSKLESGKLGLRASEGNIVSFIKGITMSFESVAEGKDITLKVIPEREKIELYFDKEKMTKIMTNLLSNAFKFTQDGGQITVSINETDNNKIRIKVRDTGIGIPEGELPKLFDRFYQVDSSQTREHEGTGIGLALTKELVELHHGSIKAESKPGDPDTAETGLPELQTNWTEFTIDMLSGREHLKEEEIVETKESDTDGIVVDKEEFIQSAVEEANESNVTDEDKNIILVVEDKPDIREFIKDSLDSGFRIEEASNGEQGVRKAEQIIPDLIISDIMMPKMDGHELTRRIKNDEKTSHIPIILLTAKSEQQSRLEGLETGADEYLTKPFDTKELQIRINNLISIRRKLQEKYSRTDFDPVKKSEEKKLSNLEEQFMNKVLEVIENHLSEEEFSIEQLGKEVGMSRAQLHRKLKALSGKSASIYLRSVRLNKAKKMIEEQKGNISEIAYSVGFSSPQYFTRCFKEEFGIPPSKLTI